MKVGYARVSSTDQSLDIQEAALLEAGCEKLFQEKRSGTKMGGREALASALEWVREGDALVVTRLDRLARSLPDLLAIVDRLRGKGVDLVATEQAIDTETPAGRAFLQMLGVFAEFETAIRRERQREGIDKAKAAGRYVKTMVATPGQVDRLRRKGMGASEIARQLGIGRATVYRLSALPWGVVVEESGDDGEETAGVVA